MYLNEKHRQLTNDLTDRFMSWLERQEEKLLDLVFGKCDKTRSASKPEESKQGK